MSCSSRPGWRAVRRSTSKRSSRLAFRRIRGGFLEGLPITGAGVRADVSPPEAPDYSSLYGITSLPRAPGPDVRARHDAERRVRRQADVQPAARADRAGGRRCPSTRGWARSRCCGRCSATRALHLGVAAATRSARPCRCGRRCRLAAGAANAPTAIHGGRATVRHAAARSTASRESTIWSSASRPTTSAGTILRGQRARAADGRLRGPRARPGGTVQAVLSLVGVVAARGLDGTRADPAARATRPLTSGSPRIIATAPSAGSTIRPASMPAPSDLAGPTRRLTPALMPSPPNILYLHSHDTGRYVQPYGTRSRRRTSSGWPIRG